jgi:hypothetical protein
VSVAGRRSGKPLTAEHRIVAAAVLIGLATVALATRTSLGLPDWWALPVLTAAIFIAEATAVRMVIGRQGWSFSLVDAVLAIGFVVAPGWWISLGMVIGFCLSNARRSEALKLVFNGAQYGMSVTVGVAVTLALGSSLPAAAVGLLVYAVLNHLLVGIPVSMASGTPYLRVISATGSLGIVHQAGNISVGLLAGWLSINAPTGLIGLVVPIGLLWWSYQQQTRRASEVVLYAELARGQERVGGSADASTEVVLIAAARMFGGAEVEMLVQHPEGLLRYVGDETGVTARLRVDADALDAPWVLRALAARGVFVGQDGNRPFCSAVLGDPERPQAVLVAYRPEKAAPFTRADAQLAEVLVRQAESWLSVAELSARRDEAIGRAEAYGAANRVLGEVSQETEPALAVLRESAHRLSRLATRFNGPDAVDEIVSELYSVERAVASLLGAIALASDAQSDDAAVAVGPAEAARPESEWTTTGRLEDAVGP